MEGTEIRKLCSGTQTSVTFCGMSELGMHNMRPLSPASRKIPGLYKRPHNLQAFHFEGLLSEETI